jgi:hypothetical protein
LSPGVTVELLIIFEIAVRLVGDHTIYRPFGFSYIRPSGGLHKALSSQVDLPLYRRCPRGAGQRVRRRPRAHPAGQIGGHAIGLPLARVVRRSEAQRGRRADAGTLLHDVRQLVRHQALACRGTRVVPVRAEEDMAADRERVRVQRLTEAVSRPVGVDRHLAEVRAECPPEPLVHLRVDPLPPVTARLGHLVRLRSPDYSLHVPVAVLALQLEQGGSADGKPVTADPVESHRRSRQTRPSVLTGGDTHDGVWPGLRGGLAAGRARPAGGGGPSGASRTDGIELASSHRDAPVEPVPGATRTPSVSAPGG